MISLMLGYGILSGQSRVECIVLDAETLKQIDFATVAVLNPVDSNYLDYGMTQIDGDIQFVLTDTVFPVLIKVQKIGFRDTSFLIKLYDTKEKLVFKMKQADFVLEEIIINEKAPKVLVRNDTTRIDPKQFTTGEERKIEDVLKKLPGISIDEKGTIKYQNKAISKVLYDGIDLLENNYTIGTKNISSDIIDKVEVIDNYINNALMKGFVRSDEQVLNIVMDDKVKNNLSGSIDLGSGYGNNVKYLANAYLFNFKKKSKSFLLHNTNNVRQDAGEFSVHDLTNNVLEQKYDQNLFRASTLYAQPSKSTYNTVLSEPYYINGLKSISQIKSEIQLSSKSKLKISGIYNTDNQTYTKDETNLYFVASETLTFANSATNTYKEKNHLITAEYEYLDLSNGFSFVNKSKTAPSSITSMIDLNRNNQALSTSSMIKPMYFSNYMDFVKIIAGKLLQLNIQYEANTINESSKQTNPLFEANFGHTTLYQNNSGSFKNLGILMNIINRKNINYDLSLGFQSQNQQILTDIYANNSSLGQQFGNTLDRRDKDMILQAKHFKVFKGFKYDITLSLLQTWLDQANKNYNFLSKNLGLAAQYNLPSWWTIKAEYTNKDLLSNILTSYSNPIIIDYQSYAIGDTTISQGKYEDIKLSVKKKNDFVGYYLTIYGGINNTFNTFGDAINFTDVGIFQKTLFYPLKTKMIYTGLNASYIITEIKSKITVSSNFNNHKGINIINDNKRHIETNRLNTYVEYFAGLKYFNIKGKYNWIYTTYQFDTNNIPLKSDLRKLSFYLNLIFSKNWTMENAIVYTTISSIQDKNSILTSELSLNYKINKATLTNFNLKVINPLNSKTFDQSYLSDYSILTSKIKAIPRFFYLTVSLSL